MSRLFRRRQVCRVVSVPRARTRLDPAAVAAVLAAMQSEAPR